MFFKIWQLLLKVPILQYIRVIFYVFDSIALPFIRRPVREEGRKRVLIVFPLSLGDAVMMLGAVETLRKELSSDEYEISVICHKPYAELFEPYVDCVIPTDIRRASVSPKTRVEFLGACRKQYYDLVLDPTGCEECTPGVFAVNAACASRKIGVLSARKKNYQLPEVLRNKVFDEVIHKSEQNVHRVRYYSEVLSEAFGITIAPKLAELPKQNQLVLPENYIVVFPSASTEIKRWPLESFVEITERIIEKEKSQVVVCGTEMDSSIVNQFVELLEKNIQVTNLVEKTTIPGLIEVISKANLVFTNDTSVYHIAVASGCKTCCVTGDYVHDMFIDYEKELLVSKDRVRAVMPDWDCKNCENNCTKVRGETYPCVLANSVEQVWNNVNSLLEGESR